MKIILLQNVPGLGTIGDIVSVKDGYARNYLIPQNLAVQAQESQIKTFEHQKKQIKTKLEKVRKHAEELAKRISAISCTIARHVGEEDKLFGSVTARDIAEALREDGFSIDHHQIQLEEPIKYVGVYQVPIKLHKEVECKVKVWVVSK